MSHGTGYKKDSHFKPVKTHRDVLGAHATIGADALPDTATNSDLITGDLSIKDQRQTSSCVGQTISEMAASYMAGVFSVFLELSAFCCYWAARAKERILTGGQNTVPLQDVGAEPTLAVLGVQAIGIASEASWSSADDSTVNNEEVLSEAEDAVTRIGITTWATVDAAPGPDRILAVRQALSAFHGASVGFSVNASTDAFQNADGATALTTWGGQNWNHYVSLVDYSKVVSITNGVAALANGDVVGVAATVLVGSFLFLMRNHWSKTWSSKNRIPGCCYVDESFVTDAADLTMLTAAPVAAKRAA